MGKGLVALAVSDVWIQSGICRSVSVERSQKFDVLKHHPDMLNGTGVNPFKQRI